MRRLGDGKLINSDQSSRMSIPILLPTKIAVPHLPLEQAIYGDLFQVVPRFGTWNNNAATNWQRTRLATLGIGECGLRGAMDSASSLL